MAVFGKKATEVQSEDSMSYPPLNEVGFLARLGFKPIITKRRQKQREEAWEKSAEILKKMRGQA